MLADAKPAQGRVVVQVNPFVFQGLDEALDASVVPDSRGEEEGGGSLSKTTDYGVRLERDGRREAGWHLAAPL